MLHGGPQGSITSAGASNGQVMHPEHRGWLTDEEIWVGCGDWGPWAGQVMHDCLIAESETDHITSHTSSRVINSEYARPP